MSKALEGCRVVDFGQGVAGPYCGMLLGDFGADVIKVEPIRGDWSRSMGTRVSATESTTYLSVNRNKRNICLDLSKTEGRTIAQRLVAKCDVVVESFRPGVMDRMGLGYESSSASNPRLIYCSVTGFGEDGPYAQLPAGDSTMQAIAGIMSIVGEPGGAPLRIGNVVSDMLAGMHGLEAVLLSIIERDKTGRGKRASISLMETMLAFQAPPLVEYIMTDKLPERSGNAHPLLSPSGVIETADKPVTFTVLEHQWSRFCDFIGNPQLASDPRFRTNEARMANRAELTSIVQDVFARRPSQEVLESMRAADILCAPVNSYAEIVKDEHVIRTGSLGSMSHAALGAVPYVANPIRFWGQEQTPSAPPVLGEHTRMILRDDLGLDPEEIDKLAAAGVIGPKTLPQSGDA